MDLLRDLHSFHIQNQTGGFNHMQVCICFSEAYA